MTEQDNNNHGKKGVVIMQAQLDNMLKTSEKKEQDQG